MPHLTHCHHPPFSQTLLYACGMGFSLLAGHQNGTGAGELWPGLSATWLSLDIPLQPGPHRARGSRWHFHIFAATLRNLVFTLRQEGDRATQAGMATLVPEDAVAPLGCAWGGGELSLQPPASAEPADSPCPSWSLPTCAHLWQCPSLPAPCPSVPAPCCPCLLPAHCRLLLARPWPALPVVFFSLPPVPAPCSSPPASPCLSLPGPCLWLIPACSLLSCLFPAHPCLLLAHCCPARPHPLVPAPSPTLPACPCLLPLSIGTCSLPVPARSLPVL